jgi:rare lipoprotein A
MTTNQYWHSGHSSQNKSQGISNPAGNRWLAIAGAALLAATAQHATARANPLVAPPEIIEEGKASFYGPGWQGRRTASGERYNMMGLTAAHHWLPFGSRVRVVDQETGREVVVTITDRLGHARRVIDLSVGAARELGILHQGLAHVTLERT